MQHQGNPSSRRGSPGIPPNSQASRTGGSAITSHDPRGIRRRTSSGSTGEAELAVAGTTAVRGGDEFLSSRLPVQARVGFNPPRRGLGGREGPSAAPSLSSSARGGTSFTVSASSERAPPRRRDSFPTPTSTGSFGRPPPDPSGRVCDASDRPLLCMSIRGDEAVVGGADHALYSYEVSTGKLMRRLYTKTHGHIDWVSTVVHLPDGRVLSGGGDGKVCLWPAGRGTQCHDLDGHASAVAKVQAVAESGRLAMSAGYDGKIKLWDTTTRRMLTCLDGLEPMMDFVWEGNLLVSGNRKGYCQVWDLKRADMIRSLKAHKGHVTAMSKHAGDEVVFLSGGQDGALRVWDSRAESCVHRVECHASAEAGTGAVSCIETSGPLVVTGGADKRVCVMDARRGFDVLHRFTEHADFVYSLHLAPGDVAFSGGGNGMMLCHDLIAGRLLYGLGANQGAVRCIGTSGEHLVVAGDDGKCLIFDC